MFDLKTLVAQGKRARIQKVQSGVVTYITDDGFTFRVEPVDMGDTEFPGECSAITLMKFIKRALNELQGHSND